VVSERVVSSSIRMETAIRKIVAIRTKTVFSAKYFDADPRILVWHAEDRKWFVVQSNVAPPDTSVSPNLSYPHVKSAGAATPYSQEVSNAQTETNVPSDDDPQPVRDSRRVLRGDGDASERVVEVDEGSHVPHVAGSTGSDFQGSEGKTGSCDSASEPAAEAAHREIEGEGRGTVAGSEG